jgi:drug/metabolite transporter superfamily protein YnfA
MNELQMRPGGTEVDGDRGVLRLGALAGLLGVILEIVAQSFHAGHDDPNNSALVFHEYAESTIWTAVHLAQFLGAFMVALALLAICRTVIARSASGRAPALVGGLAVVTSIAVFAVQMAVDGVVLKQTITAWLGASTSDAQATAFAVAEGVRWLEKALSGMFHVLNGTALLSLGVSMLVGRTAPRVLGVLGVLAGAAFVAGGYVTEHTGFSADAGSILGPAALLGAAFLVGGAAWMWRLTVTRGGVRHPVREPSAVVS